jgi:hypothetical protein
MLLQTNSYIVPKDKRSEHTRLLRKFRQTLVQLGCESFEVYEQVGANWALGDSTGRFVQIIRFRDRQQQQQVQAKEKQDPAAQQLIADFCALINFPYQQQQGLFAVGFYNSALPVAPARVSSRGVPASGPAGAPPIETVNVDTSSVVDGMAPAPQPSAEVPSALTAVPDEENPTLLNFAALAPVTDEPEPLRLTPENEDVLESEIPAEETPPAIASAESSPNGEHPGAFSDAPEAMLDLVQNSEVDAEILSDSDREAIFGELTGDDVATDPADASSDEANRTSRTS